MGERPSLGGEEWVHCPDHRVLRTATKRRMLRRLAEHPTKGALQSYAGLLQHGNAAGLVPGIKEMGKENPLNRANFSII
jgi:hypothetical protein